MLLRLIDSCLIKLICMLCLARTEKIKHAQNLLKLLYLNRSTIQVQSKVLITALIIFILFIAMGIECHF